METSLARLLFNNTRLFQQKIGDYPTNRIMLKIKLDVHVFSETWWIVISIGFCIAKRLENRVGLNQHIFHSEIRTLWIAWSGNEISTFLLPFDIVLWMGICYCRNIFHDNFWSLCFSSSGFTADHYTSVAVLLFQHPISGISNSINVRWILKKLAPFIFGNELISINVHYTVGVHGNGYFTDVSVNLSCLVSVIKSKKKKTIKQKAHKIFRDFLHPKQASELFFPTYK